MIALFSENTSYATNPGRATFQQRVVLLVLLCLSFVLTAKAQDTITPAPVSAGADTMVAAAHSAHKATLYSLALPGLGQAYNRKYWKIPLIYAGFGALAYNFSINNKEMKLFTEAYRYVTNKDTFPTDNPYVTRYPDPNDLQRGREFYRRRVELTVIVSAAWYILNVIDAAVDAHFFDYDINDNLSLRVDPVLMMPSGVHDQYAAGFRLCLSL